MSSLLRTETYCLGGLDPRSIDDSRIQVKEDRKLRVPGEISDQVSSIVANILAVVYQHSFDDEIMYLTRSVVAEALDNLVCHGLVTPEDRHNCEDGEFPLIDVSRRSIINLTIIDHRDRYGRAMAVCTLTIFDQTPPFDDTKVFDPENIEDVFNSTGRGTYMIRALGATVLQIPDHQDPDRKSMQYSWRQR